MEGGQTNAPPQQVSDIADVVVKIMNFFLILFRPRKVSNFRWANTVRDAFSFVGEFTRDQFTKIYGRITTKYKYHPQQRYQNAIRQFNVTGPLAEQMLTFGNVLFYHEVCGKNLQIDTSIDTSSTPNFQVDLTRISDIGTATTSANYVYTEVCSSKGEEAAQAARSSYLRGFSRAINALDHDDWERLRNELRDGKHLGAGTEDQPGDNLTLIAISYKGKEVKITRRMRILNDDGSPMEGSLLSQTDVRMTDDFVDDFRWSQLVRTCMEIARLEGTNQVRIWVDRLVMMGKPREEISRIYDLVEWEDFGLFSYAVCPVVRLYDAQEPYYGTDFWRKLETVMGVAGRGLFTDDYMLRKYDNTIYFGPSVYKRLGSGLSKVGGGGVFIRSVTLALATAVLTDGVSTSAANEDKRTKAATGAWKAWALRTIAEGAYSKLHSTMLRKEIPFAVGYRQFMIITFWESMVSRCPSLYGDSYLDMSFQRSITWRKSACWDGVLEWIGMLENSCEIQDRSAIMRFLTERAEIELWASTTGHVAAMINLTSSDVLDKRTLVVDLSRFSTARRGHVTAVAEATGLRREKILPLHLRFIPDPDTDQVAIITREGVVYTYGQMKVEYSCLPVCRKIVVILINLMFLPLVAIDARCILISILVWMISALIYFCCCSRRTSWPWFDLCDVGEAVFDNLLLHALYDSGIKKQYRRLRGGPYEQIGWTGLEDSWSPLHGKNITVKD